MRVYKLPPLYAHAAKSGTKFWEICVEEKEYGADIIVQHGLTPAHSSILRPKKLQRAVDKILKGKNIGKTNETTPWEQACAQAKSKWQKKIDKGYAEKRSDADKSENTRPMLAHKYQDRGSYLKDGDPVFFQPKRDGVRAIALRTKDGVSFLTRAGKSIPGVPHIEKELKSSMLTGDMLDGELFHKDIPFEEIVGLVRREPKDKRHEKLEFWVFDVPSNGAPGYGARFVRNWNPVATALHVKKVETIQTKFSEAVMIAAHEKYIEDGFEGLIIRPDDSSPYEHKRSPKLLKYKTFQDAEFTIVGVHEGIGSLEGHMGAFEVKTADGKTFKAKLDGKHSRLKKLWETRKDQIGKRLTVRYQCLTKYGVPRFPVGKAIRESE